MGYIQTLKTPEELKNVDSGRINYQIERFLKKIPNIKFYMQKIKLRLEGEAVKISLMGLDITEGIQKQIDTLKEIEGYEFSKKDNTLIETIATIQKIEDEITKIFRSLK